MSSNISRDGGQQLERDRINARTAIWLRAIGNFFEQLAQRHICLTWHWLFSFDLELRLGKNAFCHAINVRAYKGTRRFAKFNEIPTLLQAGFDCSIKRRKGFLGKERLATEYSVVAAVVEKRLPILRVPG